MTGSPNDTVVVGPGASIIDSAGNVWTIDAKGQIKVNGKVDQTTANVDELAYSNGVVWQKNADDNWYSKTSPSAPWVQWMKAAAPVPVPGVSSNDATIAAGGTTTLVDANGNVWSLVETSSANGYRIAVDGVVDPTTANVVQMAIVNGTVWQQNTADLWYSKTTPASTWSAPTPIDPLTGSVEPVSLTWTGGGNNNAANPADWSPAVAPQAGDTLTMGSGTMNLSGQALAGDTLDIAPGATADIDTSGSATLTLATISPSSHINIDVARGSTLTLTATVGSAYLDASGGTLSFIGTSNFGGFSTVLDDNLAGSGTLNLNGGNADGEAMEVNGSVGSGLRFDISAPGPCDAGLQIDHPSTFQAAVELQSGWVGFMGLRATSAELANGFLELFNGRKLVDATKFVSAPNDGTGTGLQVQQNGLGVMVSIGIGDNDQPGGIGTPIKLT